MPHGSWILRLYPNFPDSLQRVLVRLICLNPDPKKTAHHTGFTFLKSLLTYKRPLLHLSPNAMSWCCETRVTCPMGFLTFCISWLFSCLLFQLAPWFPWFPSLACIVTSGGTGKTTNIQAKSSFNWSGTQPGHPDFNVPPVSLMCSQGWEPQLHLPYFPMSSRTVRSLVRLQSALLTSALPGWCWARTTFPGRSVQHLLVHFSCSKKDGGLPRGQSDHPL